MYMAQRNFYTILGVPQKATPDTIRTAYRDLAKRHHPDRVGAGSASRFRDVAEAYRVLSDPERRRAHNQEVGMTEAEEKLAAEPMSAGPPREAEPLLSEGVSIPRALRAGRPTVEEEFFDWTARHFMGVHLPKSGRAEHLNVEVVLSPNEAERGGILPIRVPIFVPCPFCGGTGRDWLYPCVSCGAHGIIQDEESVRIRIPGMVRDGTIWELPLAGSGVHLRLHIRVDLAALW
jgi:DnaJ-class molecular chaperone